MTASDEPAIAAQRDVVISIIGAAAAGRSDSWVRGAYVGIRHNAGRSEIVQSKDAAFGAALAADREIAHKGMIADMGAAWRNPADRLGDAAVRYAAVASPLTAAADARSQMIERLSEAYRDPFRRST